MSDQTREPLDDDEVRWGLIYTHNRANANTAELEETAATLVALADLLIERGLLDRAELEATTAEAAKRVRQRFKDRGMTLTRREFTSSKYDVPPEETPQIDCAARIHLCKGVCCKLRVALSSEDVREGVLDWDVGDPYALRKRDDGYCCHMNADKGCTAYEQRPMPCRGFDCRDDARIWLDFEARIPNPAVNESTWPLGVSSGNPGADMDSDDDTTKA
jgi:Fe-S-cluster containining protein